MMRYGLLLLIFLLAACGQEAGRDEKDLQRGAILYTIDFEADTAFETGNFSDTDSSRPFASTLTIQNGGYQIQHSAKSSSYIWGQGGDSVQEVDIEVEAQFVEGSADNFYGVMCRVNENSEGYIFLISSDGYGAIARTDGRSLSFLADWREHEAIKKGKITNKIRAVCVDDYLALYVNGKLVVDIEDDELSETGQIGLAAGILTETREETEVSVTFDNLVVREASLKQ